MDTPEIIFSEWYSWEEIRDIPNSTYPGLYIIARFDQRPNGSASPCSKEILYIGETHGKSQNIGRRLQKFIKASQVGKGFHKHSGGNRFNRVIGNDLANIYAASFAPKFVEGHLLNPFILYIERKLIWEYTSKWGAIPVCNGC